MDYIVIPYILGVYCLYAVFTTVYAYVYVYNVGILSMYVLFK